MLNKYISAYISGFDFEPCENISGEVCGINFEIDVTKEEIYRLLDEKGCLIFEHI